MGALPRIQDFDDPAYDPFVSDDASFGAHDDPYPQLARWREQGPVHAFDYRTALGLHPDVTMADLPAYLVLGYDAVEKVFLDPQTLRQLVNAGGDTTYRGTSILLAGLLTHPEQLEAVREDRSLIPQAIEEALRWDGPVLIATRAPSVDTELCGV